MRQTERALNESWRVVRDATDVDAETVLTTDRLWAGYSLADLEPPLRAYSTFATAQRGAGEPEAACLFLRHPAFNAMIPHGEPAGVSAILDGTALLGETFVLARPEHWAALAHHFTFTRGFQVMARMAVNSRTFLPVERRAGTRRLTLSDVTLARELYAGYPGNAFNDDQLATGVFFGAFDPATGRRLVAVAGTHAIGRRYRIGAVGGVFTRPEARGRGFAAALTSAVTAELFALGCDDVILNVAVANLTARRVYARLGFVEHCRYREARAALKATVGLTDRRGV